MLRGQHQGQGQAHFHVILTGKSFYDIMFVIQGDLQGQF